MGQAFQIGRSIGMTEDAMRSRLFMETDRMVRLLASNCINISSLQHRHGQRCQQVFENEDGVLFEYLNRR